MRYARAQGYTYDEILERQVAQLVNTRASAGDTAYELAAAILAGEIEAPQRRVPLGLRKVVERGLARGPNKE